MISDAEENALRARMRDILLSPAAQKINFHLEGFHVDGSGFAKVARLLSVKPRCGHGFFIRVRHHLPKGVGAKYMPLINTFVFPMSIYGQAPFQRRLILHECVHALRDSQARKALALYDEAAAYLADALFYVHDTTPKGASGVTQDLAKTSGPFGVAHRIAQGIVEEGHMESIAKLVAEGKMTGKDGYVVDLHDIDELLGAIREDPAYKFIKTFPGWKYLNNGVSL